MRTSGPGPAPVNRSPTRARGAAFSTLDIFGQHGSHSSRSVALQSSLESKLRQRLASSGSILFVLTWNDAVTPSGRRICALRASARPTSASACSSWPTPTVSRGDYSYAHGDHDAKTLKLAGVAKLVHWPTPTVADGTAGRDTFHHGENNPTLLGAARRAGWATPAAQEAGGTPEAFLARKRNLRDQGTQIGVSVTSLSMQAKMSSWPTPQASDADRGGQAARCETGRSNLRDFAHLATWATPSARDWKSSASNQHGVNSRPLNEQARLATSGPPATGSRAPTESRGQLNPEHTRWLQGYPVGWGSYADTATRSSRK